MMQRLRQRITIPRVPAARLARIFPWVAAPLAGGGAIAATFAATINMTEGNLVAAAINFGCAAINLALVFYLGMGVGELRAIAAGAPVVVIEFGAADGSIQMVGPVAPGTERREGGGPTRH